MKPYSVIGGLRCRTLFRLLLAVSVGISAWAAVPGEPHARSLSLEECVFTALRQNRTLQIERLGRSIAKSYLNASYGYYSPVLTAEANSQNTQDNGGFDPSDFSRYSLVNAESETARTSMTGMLPWGMSYSLLGSYAHSDGLRNYYNFESYTLQTGISLRQPLLRNFWIDQGRLAIQVRKKDLRITELGVHYVAMDVINRVQQAYYELACATGQVAVQRGLMQAREEFLHTVKRRIEMGILTALDERLAEARLSSVSASLVSAENTVRLAENELKNLLGDGWTNSVESRVVASDPLPLAPHSFSLDDCWQRGLASRPDLAQLREDSAKSKLDLKYRRNQLFPSLDVVASHVRRGASTDQKVPPLPASASLVTARDQIGSGDVPADMIGLIFSLPLGRAAERGNFRASKDQKEQAELRVKQHEELVMRQISDAYHTARAESERISLTRRTRELSEAALDAENQKLTGGKSTLFLVLELQNDLATARAAELRAQADHHRAVSQLRFSEGSLLEYWNCSIELN